MTRFPALLASMAASFVLLSATAANARPANAHGPFYQATAVAAPSADKLIIRGNVWKCAGAECASANPGESRAAIICEALAKEVGALSAFRAGDQAFDDAALAKCNAKA